jgi:hypothetical protein
MSTWNRRRAILAGIAAMFTPAVAKGTPAAASITKAPPGLDMEWDYYMRGGTPILGALNSKFKFGTFRPDTAI